MSSGSSSRPIAIDLFCGAGGLSEGLIQAGFDVRCAIDMDRHALQTYEKNHKNTTVIDQDIMSLNSDDIMRHVNAEVDLIAGGPSCQGYSTHGRRIENDPRNFLFKEFARIVGDIRPKFFLIENVKGLLTYNSGYFVSLIRDSFVDLGYSVDCKVLCAADYGVPQLRERIFFIGTRLQGSTFRFPEPTHAPPDLAQALGLNPYVTVGDALGDIPLLGDNFSGENLRYHSTARTPFQKYARESFQSDFVTMHAANSPSKLALNIIRLVDEGSGLRSVDADMLPERFSRMRRLKDGSLRRDCTTLYYRLSRQKPAYTITCNFRNVASGPFVHPLENRSLSFREAARLMSFRDSYEFCPPSLPKQIGNAVPPLLAKAVGEAIANSLVSVNVTKITKKSARKRIAIA